MSITSTYIARRKEQAREAFREDWPTLYSQRVERTANHRWWRPKVSLPRGLPEQPARSTSSK